MSFAWYGNQTDTESCRFGALALIFPLLERMNVMEILNRHLPADARAEYDFGTTLSLLMAARLYHPTALSNVAQWAEDSGADLLWDIPPEKLNDDRLGRALDAFFPQRHSILASLSLHVSRQFDVPLRNLHYDPTHILFEGAYENAQPRKGVIDRDGPQPVVRSDDRLDAAHITKGRATDDAPKGARMIHAGLATHVDEFGPLPLFGHTIDGNQNGRTAIDEHFGLLRKHLRPAELTMISDRGTFSAGHLQRLAAEGFHAICSVPWGEFKDLFDQNFNQLNWKQASYLSIEQQRRRSESSSLPREHYELAVVRHELFDAESKQTIGCRVVFVYSSADEKVSRQQRDKQIERIRRELEKTKKNVARRGPHSDVDAVGRRMKRLLTGPGAARYFSWQIVKLSKKEQQLSSDPGSRLPTHCFEYTFDKAALLEDQEYDGYSAIVTTVPQNQQSADALFTRFKQQTYSEQVNRSFKGPLAVSPVFLHTPERVEALVFLMIMVLMVYYLLQRLYRQNVADDAPETERRTTARTLLQAFSSYCLVINRSRLGREVCPTRLTTRQRKIIQQLGFKTPAQILQNRLPRPPT